MRITFLVTAGGRRYPYSLDFTAFPRSGAKRPGPNIHANLRNGSFFSGEVRFGGRSVRIAVADLDADGIHGEVEEGPFEGDRFFLDLDGDGSWRGEGLFSGPRLYEPRFRAGYPCGGVTRIEGRYFSVRVRPDGGEVTIASADPALGTVEAGPEIVYADLRSATQPSPVEFEEGRATTVAGAYVVREMVLCVEDRAGRIWQAHGEFPEDDAPRVVVPEHGTGRLSAGPPLTVRPVVEREENGTLSIRLEITGTAGEAYVWSEWNPGAAKPGFEILDGSGRRIASASFEYG